MRDNRGDMTSDKPICAFAKVAQMLENAVTGGAVTKDEKKLVLQEVKVVRENAQLAVKN